MTIQTTTIDVDADDATCTSDASIFIISNGSTSTILPPPTVKIVKVTVSSSTSRATPASKYDFNTRNNIFPLSATSSSSEGEGDNGDGKKKSASIQRGNKLGSSSFLPLDTTRQLMNEAPVSSSVGRMGLPGSVLGTKNTRSSINTASLSGFKSGGKRATAKPIKVKQPKRANHAKNKLAPIGYKETTKTVAGDKNGASAFCGDRNL